MPSRNIVHRERYKRRRQGVDDIRIVKQTTSSVNAISVEDGCNIDDDIDETQVPRCFSFPSHEIMPLDMQNEIRKHFDKCKVVELDVALLLKRREDSTVAINSIRSVRDLFSNDVIRLNVGDEIFTVPLQVLLSKDNNKNFFDVLFGFCKQNNGDSREKDEDDSVNSYFQTPLVDETGALFIDRDPNIFRIILSYLRGYRLLSVLNEEQISMLKTDARYFNLRELINELGDDTAAKVSKFKPGPGVNPERNRFRVIYGVAVVGQRFLITGRHRIVFQVMNSDYVGIGLVSDSCVSTDQEFHKTLHCCVYYMTGVFYSNFPHHRKEDGLEALERGDYVSLMVDMDKRVAEYSLKGSTKMISLGNARKLRFAVAMKLSSSVRIVSEEEARNVTFFRRGVHVESPASESRAQPFGDSRDPLTQLSQPNGAGSLGPAGAQEQQASLSQQQPHDISRLFISPGTNITTRSGLIDGVVRTTRTVVLSSFTGGSSPNDMSEIDPILFVPGNSEEL